MEQFVVTKSRNKNLSSRKELELLDKQELIDKVLQLEAHTIQLKNIIKKVDNVKSDKKQGKVFDFAQCNKRHILLKFYYLGWNYSGFVEQEDTINTIEHHIFQALKRSCLIEQRETCNYHRCGRTDKGVSAYSQVISLDIRSRLEPEEQTKLKEELSYCKILNRILPKDIRCTAWAPVADEYSARFDCKTRSYRYYFPRGDLDIEAMNRAAGYLVGHHDFRNLCKMDVANGVVTFERTVIDAKIVVNIQDSSKQSGYDMCQLIIKSQAFLWHQIRCIMGILLLVGQKKEDPEIINYLFDIEKCPRKPQYNLAHELPLNLFYCHYDDVEWFYDESEVEVLIKTLQEEWTLNAIKAEMIKSIIDDLSTHSTSEGFNYQSDCLIQGVQAKVHQPLMKRITCESLENRIKHFEKKRRIEIKNPSKENT
ncbi:tRNA pseudouridine(38/39) synthase [Microplitis demolitor]|uniref:tRNA pseudouridine(38/39) synthase n=1 Tax=Microplitis demolitor TaxID=69319 RepID=UPI0004CDA2D5|nr:tRNA pseudouridine(38/39) synthase [Microplitis demolitor]XP_053595926.1 tRNA pseudouridine(38/39) synthase [Microplitis demolitor]